VIPVVRIREELARQDLAGRIYFSRSAFWVVHHEAINEVYRPAHGFFFEAAKQKLALDVSAGLGFAMQVLCGNPARHLLERQPGLSAGDDEGRFAADTPDGEPWKWRAPFGGPDVEVQPAIIHVPWSRPRPEPFPTASAESEPEPRGDPSLAGVVSRA
jgi:hypothetical protein